MLDSLSVKNYRNLKDLRIESLGRVNLIVGKNNTGKSSLLEAVSIYASKANPSLIDKLLDERGENINFNNHLEYLANNLDVLSSLFFNREITFFDDNSIEINVVESNSIFSGHSFVSLRFIKFFDEIIKQDTEAGEPKIIRNRKIINQNDIFLDVELQTGLEIISNKLSRIINLSSGRFSRPISLFFEDFINFQYVRSRNIENDINAKLWDKITLTEKENFVINALKIIEDNIDRVNFITADDYPRSRERKAVAKLKNNDKILPLKSMGDGINRILTIILALVNSSDGFLLIDEFENGLHHSVQEQLWKVIFKLSKDLNIQVFATTHSEDCIRSFTEVLNEIENINDGKLIRLENKNGQIRQVEFNASELQIATNNDIEVR